MNMIKIIPLLLILTASASAQKVGPPGEFTLTVESLSETETSRVVTLNVHSPEGEIVRFDQTGALRMHASLFSAVEGERKAKITLSVTEQDGRCHTLVSLETSVGLKNKSEYTLDLPRDTKLGSLLSVTATNGVYKFDRPLQIGTLHDKPIMLTIGTRTVIENMRVEPRVPQPSEK
jgi:hypothetical protein